MGVRCLQVGVIFFTSVNVPSFLNIVKSKVKTGNPRPTVKITQPIPENIIQLY